MILIGWVLINELELWSDLFSTFLPLFNQYKDLRSWFEEFAENPPYISWKHNQFPKDSSFFSVFSSTQQPVSNLLQGATSLSGR